MKPRLLAFCLVAGATHSASAQFVLVDDFTDGNVSASPAWSIIGDINSNDLTVVPNPATASGGEVLEITRRDGGTVEFYTPFTYPASVPDPTLSPVTFYFEYFVPTGTPNPTDHPSQTDIGIGLTDLDTPAAYGDFSSRIQIKADSGGGFDQKFGYGEWYGIWMIVDQASATFQLYYKTATIGQTLVTSNGGTVNSFPLSRVTPVGEAIDQVYIRYAFGMTNDIIYFDNLYIDAGAPNSSDAPTSNLPAFADTDSDGLDDSKELIFTGEFHADAGNLTDLTTPWDGTSSGAGSGDFDGDGSSDADEIITKLTNPVNPDTDDDGLLDGVETNNGVNSFVDEDDTGTDPLAADSDGDNIPDGNEVVGLDAGGVIHGYGPTNPTLLSSDGDSLPDGWEIDNALDPLDDGSTLVDNGDAGDPDLDHLENLGEFGRLTNPQVMDSDSDGYTDYEEDGLGSWFNESTEFPGLYLTGTDPNNPDTDGDTLLDGWENPSVGTANPAVPGPSQPYNSDPNLRDTDFDQFSDLSEILNGSNPNDGGSVPLQTAGFALLEDFEGVGMSVGQTFNGVNGWTASDTLNLVADEPISGGDKVGGLDGSGGLAVPYKSMELHVPALSILDGNTGTFFFQIYSGTKIDDSYGLSDEPVPAAFSSFESQFAFNSRIEPKTIGGRIPGAVTTNESNLLVDNTWYDVWVVSNNATDTYEMWIQPAGGAKTQLTYGVGLTEFAFRNGGSTDPLISAMIVIGAASTGVSYVDNLYIDPTAANLNLPAGVISKPATPVVTDTDFRIISVSINGGGDLLIQFIPGGSGYRLTSSDDLSAAFVEETNAIYDGVDTYIVPSAFLNPDKDFFRVETAP